MYPRIVQKVFCEPWCLTVEAHYAIQRLLEERSLGLTVEPTHLHGMSNQFNAANLGLVAPKDRGSRVYTRGKLGYIPIHGIIGKGLSSMEMLCGGYSVEQLQDDVTTALENPDIQNILMHFDSPGGTVTGVPETAKIIAKAGQQKRTFAFTDARAESAAYWLASQANHVYATESAMVGSIGVYLALLDRSEELKQRGIKLKLFKAGEHKAMGVPGSTLTQADEQLLQDGVDRVYKMFTSSVAMKRPDVSRETMQGQSFMGAEARKAKLVDSILDGGLPYLVRRLS